VCLSAIDGELLAREDANQSAKQRLLCDNIEVLYMLKQR
jgi:hypothetical protein